ncbi:RIIB lysis inhibitor [Escherichia phage a15]|nr:RIIB lysis inhibitor [Escherichia phage a15]
MYNIKCLTKNEQAEIVKLYSSGNYTQQELADWQGVSVDTIRRVLKNDEEAKRPKVTISGDITVKVNSDAVIAPVAKSDIIWNASKKFISITVDGVTYNATPNTHSNFQEILNLLVADKLEEAAQKINVRRAVEKYISGDVRIEGGSLFYQNIELRSGLVDRILDSMEKGENFEFYFPFLENLLENPSQKAVSRLFDFLVANDIEITEDGYFYAWKVVRSNYFDCHSNTFDNSPGKVVKMPRTRVNDDDTQTCSRGLHVCSKSYIRHFGSSTSRVVKVKVHPRDVVSIPIDYNDAKMRTCQYEVVEDVTEQFK